MDKNILIIEDDLVLSGTLVRVLGDRGYKTSLARSKKDLDDMDKSQCRFDLALIDFKLPDTNGLELMKQLNRIYPAIQVIIMTGFGSVDLAVQAIKQGAFHMVSKPFEDIEEIINICNKAIHHARLKEENARLLAFVKKQYCFDELIGQSPVFIELISMVKKIASSQSTILITGESGTGKELVAKSIHSNSSRCDGPFVPVHCGAIPQNLLESELFGHIKGAFTGAHKNRAGKFLSATGGTLFLDEVGTMDPATQIKLLRVLQDGEFHPVGSDTSVKSDVRIIVATNENLENKVAEGQFRKDLFYRLNVIPVNLPPLRQRAEDIPLLIQHFLKDLQKRGRDTLSFIEPEAMQKLISYRWPGNVRELENLIERLSVVKIHDTVGTGDLPPQFHYTHKIKPSSHQNTMEIPEQGLDFYRTVRSFENDLILKALKKTGWNRNQAAKLLKLNRTTLLDKIKKKGLTQDLSELVKASSF